VVSRSALMPLLSSKECNARMAEFRLSPAAERGLENIWMYTGDQWGTEQAHSYMDILTAEFNELARSRKQLRPVSISVPAIAVAMWNGTSSIFASRPTESRLSASCMNAWTHRDTYSCSSYTYWLAGIGSLGSTPGTAAR
jgi:plasmid stabilization system protein ParE